MPLMKELGILWQTGAISPSHEHFITNLVKQNSPSDGIFTKNKFDQQNHPIFVLFLPENEIHELGILYLNYLILSRGYRTIFWVNLFKHQAFKLFILMKLNIIL